MVFSCGEVIPLQTVCQWSKQNHGPVYVVMIRESLFFIAFMQAKVRQLGGIPLTYLIWNVLIYLILLKK